MKQAGINMKRYLKIYYLFFKYSLALLASHRFNFIMSAVSNVLWTLGQVISLQFIFERVQEFNGWSISDMLFLLGFGQLYVYTMFIFYQSNHDMIESYIITGDLDRMLTKPINLKFFLSFEGISVLQIIPCFVTVVPLLAIGFSGLQSLSPFDVVFAFIVFIIGAVILFFFSLTLSGINFFTDSAQSLRDTFANLTDSSRIPLTFFPTVIQFTFSFVIPLGFVTFYPTSILKNEQNALSVIIAELIVLAIFILLSKLVWGAGLKRYSGAA